MEQLDKQLLNIIMTTDQFTAKQLADRLGISDKTARERLKRVENEVRQNGGEITSKPGKGHLFRIIDEKRFSEWYKGGQKAEGTIPATGSERVNYILHRLLYAKKHIKLDDLSNELFVSRTTMTSDMKQVKYILHLHRLTIAQRPGYGICIEGNEFDIRKCMVYGPNPEGYTDRKPRLGH